MTIEAHNQGLWPRYFLLLLIILLNLILQKSFIQTNTFIGTSDVYQPTSWPKNAKHQIVSQLDVSVDKFRIGLGQFGAKARTEFLLNTYQNIPEMINYIRSGRSFAFRGGQALRTGSAIDYLLRIFFTESAGSRKKEGVPQIAIIITSASSQDDVIVPARALRNHGVKVISIGVRNSELTEMKKIAFLPNFPFVFQISAFSALVQLSDRISTSQMTSSLSVTRAPSASLSSWTSPLHGTQWITPSSSTAFPPSSTSVVPHSPGSSPTSQTASSTSDPSLSASVADIVFLVDESGSIGTVNFQLIRSFLYNFIDILEVSPDYVHIGLAQYSNSPVAEFYLNRYQNKSDVLDHIQSMTYRGGGRNTETALNFVRQTYFTDRSGSRARIGIPQLLIVITSGESEDKMGKAAATLRRSGVIMFTNLQILKERIVEIQQSEYLACHSVGFNNLNCVTHLFSGCIETEEADIFFLIDGSGSIQPDNFQDMKMFMKEVAKTFRIGANKVRFGAVVYGTTPVVQFQLNQYKTKSDVREAIYGMQREGGSTFTALALKEAKGLLTTEEGGPRSDRVAQFLIVITDGKATDSVNVPDTSKDIRDEGINIFAVGVAEANEEELQTIVGPTGNYFYVQNFETLKSITGDISKVICANTNPGMNDLECDFLQISKDQLLNQDYICELFTILHIFAF
uniref:Collagen type VI alpha 6 chain n=1 Tax=Callorhinchus milii TaxID=7868 RepID=A0A4W3GB65_CALMI